MRSDVLILINTNQLFPRNGLTFQAGDLILSAMGTLCLFPYTYFSCTERLLQSLQLQLQLTLITKLSVLVLCLPD